MDDVDADRERKILIAVDDGEESMYALTWAIKNVISQNSKDTLVLLYAKQPPVVFTSFDGTGYLFSSDIVSLDKYRDDVAENVIERARRLCRDLNNVKVEVRVETGDPRDVICEAAEKVGADVLVMGTHGYGLIKRALVGSVSNHCSQKAKCPVLVVKKPKVRLILQSFMAERKIVAAVDESDESMYALSWFLKNVVSSSNTHHDTTSSTTSASTVLVLLYCKPPPPVYSSIDGTGYMFGGDMIETMNKYTRDLVDSVMRRAELICRDYQHQHVVRLEKIVGSGDAREVICEAVKKVEPELLVMGSHGYGFIKRALLGSVSDHCSKKVKCPVLIVKRPNN
ncbi:hypothetical protein Sjap_006930 [Stephania japonica]|uniref:UspA domain-containing protein n=1 Tax=Stephania japonica TaxID=461633 RepID=A0AAP0K6T8_9MAGN